MSAMHPESGVPPADARNSIPNEIEQSLNCDELWYSTSRCQPRFDPAAANAMLAEVITLINKGEVIYDCLRLDQVQLAVRYLIQRGLNTGVSLKIGPSDYTATMDPPITRYNDYMTLIVVPEIDNNGAVRINTNGMGLVQLLRNDRQQLESHDLKVGVPTLISYWAGNWYHIGLCPSQVPLIIKGGVVVWIRTDGNDETGDGTENTAAKAYRTIAGAWAGVGSKYAATPVFSINLRFGIPGTYQGTYIANFGGTVWLSGDTENPGAYRLSSYYGGNQGWANLFVQSIASFALAGVTLVIDIPTAAGALTCQGLRLLGTNCLWINVNCECAVSVGVGGGSMFVALEVGYFGMAHGPVNFIGNGHTMSQLVNVGSGGVWGGGMQDTLTTVMVTNLTCNYGFLIVHDLGVMQWGNNCVMSISGCVGTKYVVATNGVLSGNQKEIPGDAAGVVTSGGQFTP